uniref:Uncharacterized protein LOC111131587 n=1 Tax=Crassostrea virginica TaxID=6565 RepID=A0A8B8E311_CRAVI|nr:uncharacterized protein LOC111131587 [Crassostrea virginica]XP_022334937.1 uncharacterized protein LOC111131617 [Crassostrea virginica]
MSGSKRPAFLCLCCLVAGAKCLILQGMSPGILGNHRDQSATSSGTTIADVIRPRTHRLPCTQQEIESIGCLNGGTCFALMMEDRSIHCLCRENYYGLNCYMYYPWHIDFSEFG